MKFIGITKDGIANFVKPEEIIPLDKSQLSLLDAYAAWYKQAELMSENEAIEPFTLTRIE